MSLSKTFTPFISEIEILDGLKRLKYFVQYLEREGGGVDMSKSTANLRVNLRGILRVNLRANLRVNLRGILRVNLRVNLRQIYE